MRTWFATYVWTFFHEVIGVALCVLVGLGITVVANSLIARQSWLALSLGLGVVAVALTIWWRNAKRFIMEPDPILADIEESSTNTSPRLFSARIAADLSTAALGLTIISICLRQILASDELTTRWALLATILGGPFFALGMGAVWERVDRRILG